MVSTSRINLHGSRWFKAKDKDSQGKRVIFDKPEGIDASDGFIAAHVKLVDVSIGQWVMDLMRNAVISSCASAHKWTVDTPTEQMHKDLEGFTLELKVGDENIISRDEVLARTAGFPDKFSEKDRVEAFTLMNPDVIIL